MNISNTYKPFIGLIFLFTVVSLLNIPVLTTLWRHSFDDGTYSHAYLIPIITIYLYFKLSNNGLLVYRDKVAYIPLGLLIGSSFLLFVTSNAQISLGYWISFLAVLTTGVMSLFRFNWYIIFPSLFLIFIFPLWGLLTGLLQSISVIAVTYMMSFTGIPTYVEAEFITIPAGVFEIADGCSGLRYIIVSLAISTLFIFMYINSAKRAIVFLSIAILGALLTNWIRITALILIGEYTDMQSGLMEDHNTFGWYLYIPFMFLLFMWGNRLSTSDILNDKPETAINNSKPNKVNFIVVLSLFVVFSTTVKSFALKTSTTLLQNIASPAPTVFNASSVSTSGSFLSDEVQLLTFNFDGADLDAKPTFYNNNLTPDGWRLEDNEQLNDWNVNLISKGRKNALVLFQYEINKETFSNTGQFKKQRLIKGTTGATNTKLHWAFSECDTDCTKERKFIGLVR